VARVLSGVRPVDGADAQAPAELGGLPLPEGLLTVRLPLPNECIEDPQPAALGRADPGDFMKACSPLSPAGAGLPRLFVCHQAPRPCSCEALLPAALRFSGQWHSVLGILHCLVA